MQLDQSPSRITGALPALSDSDETRGEVALLAGRHVHAAYWQRVGERVHLVSPHGTAHAVVGRGQPSIVARALLREVLEAAAARGELPD